MIYTFCKSFFLRFDNFIRKNNISYRISPIYVLALFAICQNCFIKPAFAIERESGTKFQSGLFNDRDRLREPLILFGTPETINRKQTFKFSQNYTAEFISSFNKSFFCINAPGNVSAETNKQYASGDSLEMSNKEFDHWFPIIHKPLALLVIFVWPIILDL